MDNIVRKEQMDALKALSDVNIKVSEAKNLLFKLEENETAYLIAREEKAMDRIKKVIADSEKMVHEADKNYGQIKELLDGVGGFVSGVTEIQDKFKALLETFNQRNELWEKNIGEQQDSIEGTRKLIKVHSQIIENDKRSIEIANQILINERKHIESQQATLTTSYEAEKSLWEKLKKT